MRVEFVAEPNLNATTRATRIKFRTSQHFVRIKIKVYQKSKIISRNKIKWFVFHDVLSGNGEREQQLKEKPILITLYDIAKNFQEIFFDQYEIKSHLYEPMMMMMFMVR